MAHFLSHALPFYMPLLSGATLVFWSSHLVLTPKDNFWILPLLHSGVLISPLPDPVQATATKTYGVQTKGIYCCTNNRNILLYKQQEYIAVKTTGIYCCTNNSNILLYKQQEYIAVQTTAIYCCTNNSNIFLLFVRYMSRYSVSLGRCSLFPSRVGIRTYQHPCTV